jgi:hypothetical protein
MASDQVTSGVPVPAPAPLQAWLARLGLSGKLLAVGGLVGILAVFLPLLSFSMQVEAPGAKGSVSLPGFGVSQSVLVIQNWRGVICLLGYLAAVALAYALYQPNGLVQKSFGWAGVAVGALLALLALWLLVLAFNGSSTLSGFGASLKVSVGMGAILNLLAAAAVAAGGFLKAHEEKLI